MNANNFKKDVILNCLKDIKVELDDEFDQNFQRKCFFNTSNAWAKRKHDDGKGSLLVRSGALRRSISSHLSGDQLVYSSNVPYAAIHNEGGEITVTEKMKRYFWFKYLQIEGSKRVKEGKTKLESSYGYKKSGDKRNNKKNRELSDEAAFYKAMALKKVGDKIKIPQRQFIGDSPEVEQIVRDVVEDNIQEYLSKLMDNLKQ